jgi:lipopolysaccharide biosynthesis glycosyltransferase
MQENEAIICSADNNFFIPMLVMLCSLGRTSREVQQVYAIDGGLSAKNRDIVMSIDEKSAALNVNVVSPRPEHLDIIRAAQLKNNAQILRIFAPDLLPDHIDRYIYFDSDIVLNDDVDRLFHVDLKGNTIGAVQDFKIGHMASFLGVAFHEEAGIPAEAPYFNSGVMLVDRAKWDREQLTVKLSECLVQFGGRHRFGDQDSLNTVLYEDWSPLDPAWNVQTVAYRDEDPITEYLIYEPDALCAAVQDPSIYHFTEAKKPWHMDCENPMRHVFRNHVRECEFIGAKEAGMFVAKQLPMTIDRWLRDTSRPFRHAVRAYVWRALGMEPQESAPYQQSVS